jgi:hypothetical protein
MEGAGAGRGHPLPPWGQGFNSRKILELVNANPAALYTLTLGLPGVQNKHVIPSKTRVNPRPGNDFLATFAGNWGGGVKLPPETLFDISAAVTPILMRFDAFYAEIYLQPNICHTVSGICFRI